MSEDMLFSKEIIDRCMRITSEIEPGFEPIKDVEEFYKEQSEIKKIADEIQKDINLLEIHN